MPKTDIELETGVSIKERVSWAEKALAAHPSGDEYGSDPESSIVDLLADLFHLAEATGFDPDTLYRKAWEHYEYESKLGKEPS